MTIITDRHIEIAAQENADRQVAIADGDWAAAALDPITAHSVALSEELFASRAAEQVSNFARFGFSEGQSVTWDGETWSILTMSSDGRALLHNPKIGFAGSVPVADMMIVSA